MEKIMKRQIKVGNIKIGGGAPVSIQSMTKTDTRDIPGTIRQIKELEKSGCEIIRVAIKDLEAARAIKAIKRKINLPLVADIHFDYRLALLAIENGADKIRLNPGNIYTATVNPVLPTVCAGMLNRGSKGKSRIEIELLSWGT